MTLRPLAAALALFVLPPMLAFAQDYESRARDLVVLSRVLGELHHIRRMCGEYGEDEVWRNRMRQLIELESPQPELQNEMVAAFNDGFRQAESRFPYCDRDARDYAAASAEQGDAATRRLMGPLYDALAEPEQP